MIRVRKDQKKRTASKSGKAVEPCPKYEGKFLIVHRGTEAPAGKVRYTARPQKSAIVEGMTGDDGLTQAIKTKTAERVMLEVPENVIAIDAEGNETGREVKKVTIGAFVTSSEKNAPPAVAAVDDRLLLLVKADPRSKFAPLPLALVYFKVLYKDDERPEKAPSGGSAALDASVTKAEPGVALSREALALVTGIEVTVAPREDMRAQGKGAAAKLDSTIVLPVDGAKYAKETEPVTLAFEVTVQSPPRLFFALYYDNPSKDKNHAFVRAAETWKAEVEASPVFKKDKDIFLFIGFTTEGDFKSQWHSVYAQSLIFEVVQGQIFSHASIDFFPVGKDGLEFASDQIGNDGTLHNDEIKKLDPLRWHESGELTLLGCNTGVRFTGVGLAPVPREPAALAFAATQHVTVVGQAGFGYFSKQKDTYVTIDDTSKPVYLWAYSRRKNGLLGNGGRMPGVTFGAAPAKAGAK